MTSPARCRALEAYLRDIAERLRLTEWDIDVSDLAATDDAVLEIKPQPLRHYASVRIGKFFSTDPTIVNGPEEQRQAAVHEVLHLTQARVWEWLGEGMLRDRMSRGEAELVEGLLREELEIQADALARMLAPSIPLPPDWPDA